MNVRSIALVALALPAIVPASAQDFGAEPAAPAPPRQPEIVQIDDDTFQIGVIEFSKKSRAIRFPAVLNMRKELLEFAIVNQNGKTHESLLSTPISPYDLNVALLLLGYKPSLTVIDPAVPEENRTATPDPPEVVRAAGIECTLEWDRPDDAPEAAPPAKAPLSRWLEYRKTSSFPETAPWIYTGSKITREGGFVAESEGSILALYLDPYALINNPLEGNFDDEVWLPAADLPALDTAVTVTFSPVSPPDH